MNPDTKRMAAIYAASFPGSRPWTSQEIQEFLSDPHCVVEATHDAFAIARLAADEAEIVTIAVDLSFRRQGFAQTLLTQLASRALGRGAGRMFLEVGENNRAARAMYARFGFVESGRRRGYYRFQSQPPEDAIVMFKSLK
jgi:ribosomal-protein-alanine N-acetyltransferase